MVAAAATAHLTSNAVGQGVQTKQRAPLPPGQVATSFREDIFPIFKGRCIDCHQPGGPGYEASGLDLRTYEGLMKGTKHGPMIIPGDPDVSNLVWLLEWRASPQLRMPHGTKQLSICDRTAIRRWIMEGAKND
jgi:hypothetical protein